MTNTIELKPLDDVLAWCSGRDSSAKMLDGRDMSRLMDFLPVARWGEFGFALRDGETPPAALPWTPEVVMPKFAGDLAFAFEKALDKRGISASLCLDVVKVWCYALGATDIAETEEYAQYGLPVLKAAALRFGLPNPIGDDSGDEHKYSEYGD